MKVSEITDTTLADYLRLDYTSLSVSEKLELSTLLGVAKSFVKAYTGLKDIAKVGESLGTGDGDKVIFYIKNTPIVPETQTIYVGEIANIKDVDYSLDYYSGETIFYNAPALGNEVTADYTSGIDAHEDFVIAIYVLVQDMYDNRTLYIDKNNINKVVDTILGMHSVNLL